jgi:hypothetical protein
MNFVQARKRRPWSEGRNRKRVQASSRATVQVSTRETVGSAILYA